jgi:D-alanyl-D-alanine carboxypeptidase/D-alanyl-D-alanine-endopeptidase (penicillin-binding protein 4)
MRRSATRHGVKRDELRLRNGSGLYDANRVSSKTVVQFLEHAMQDRALASVLEKGLPVAAESGTLRNRLPGLKGRVHAKTGTLDGVSALAGYLTEGDRRTWFSILVNAPGVPVGNLRSFQDKAVKLLALHQENVLEPIKVKTSKPKATSRRSRDKKRP